MPRIRQRDRSHGLRMKLRAEVVDAIEQFTWLMNARQGERCETGENIVAALEWVLRISTKSNPLPELLAEIRKLRAAVIVPAA